MTKYFEIDYTYDDGMDDSNEDSSIAYVVDNYKVPHFFNDNLSLLKALQSLHDYEYHTFDLKDLDFMLTVHDIATQFNLEDKFNG